MTIEKFRCLPKSEIPDPGYENCTTLNDELIVAELAFNDEALVLPIFVQDHYIKIKSLTVHPDIIIHWYTVDKDEFLDTATN